MNSEIASKAAWTQADRKTQQTNIALNEYDAALHEAVVEYRLQRRRDALVTKQLLDAQRRILLRKANIAATRFGAQLRRIENPTGHGAAR